MKIESDAFSRQENAKVSFVEQARVKTEVGTKLENARFEAVEEAKEVAAQNEHSESDLRTAVDKVNQYAGVQQVSLRLSIEKELGQLVISVVDKDTDEVIRQIPSDHAIKLAKRIDEVMQEFFSGEPGRAISLLNDEA